MATCDAQSETRRHCRDPQGLFSQFTELDRALVGFLLSLTPLSMDLMGWRGAGGNGAAGTGTYFFFGGLLMIIGSVGEVRSRLPHPLYKPTGQD